MKPVVHDQVYSMEDRLKLIGGRIDASIRQPQTLRNGHKFMARDLALEIVRGAPQHGLDSEHAQVGRIFNWVKTNIEYRDDPRDYDLYMSLGRTIDAGGSDCDDHVIANCALLSSIGFLVGARICSPDNRNWHIYGLAGINPKYQPTQVIPLDTTQPESFPGWEPDRSMRQYEYQCTFREGGVVGLHKLAR